MAKHNKRKLLTQRHVCMRMNFLYQAANLMAYNKNNKLAAYYGKLCRNLGTKAVMHIAPEVKRTLCKRCSLPLMPGINTTLEFKQRQQETHPKEQQQQSSSTGVKRRNRRQRKKPVKSDLKSTTAVADTSKPQAKQKSDTIDDDLSELQLQCSLCQAKRRFVVNTQSECWLERAESVVHTERLVEVRDKEWLPPTN